MSTRPCFRLCGLHSHNSAGRGLGCPTCHPYASRPQHAGRQCSRHCDPPAGARTFLEPCPGWQAVCFSASMADPHTRNPRTLHQAAASFCVRPIPSSGAARPSCIWAGYDGTPTSGDREQPEARKQLGPCGPEPGL